MLRRVGGVDRLDEVARDERAPAGARIGDGVVPLGVAVGPWPSTGRHDDHRRRDAPVDQAVQPILHTEREEAVGRSRRAVEEVERGQARPAGPVGRREVDEGAHGLRQRRDQTERTTTEPCGDAAEVPSGLLTRMGTTSTSTSAAMRMAPRMEDMMPRPPESARRARSRTGLRYRAGVPPRLPCLLNDPPVAAGLTWFAGARLFDGTGAPVAGTSLERNPAQTTAA